MKQLISQIMFASFHDAGGLFQLQRKESKQIR